MRISDWSSDVCSSDLPDVLLCRSEQPLPDSERRKIASFTNVSEKAVISVMDLDNIHKIPMWLHAQGLDQVVAERLRLDDRAAVSADLSEWLAVVEAAEYPIDEVTIGIVGKYVDHKDAYKSVGEAPKHGGLRQPPRVNPKRPGAPDPAPDNG